MNREILNDNNMRTMYKVQKMPVRITIKMNSNKYESNNRLKKTINKTKLKKSLLVKIN